MVKLVLQGILGEPVRGWSVSPESAQDPSPCVSQVDAIGPDRPEVHEDGRVDDVKEDRGGQHGARHPVNRHPLELNAHLRKERRK